MGKYDDRPKVDIDIKDGKVILDGKELSLQQGQTKSLACDVERLGYRTANSVYDGKATTERRIVGVAVTEDRVRIVGIKESTKRFSFSVRGIEPEPDGLQSKHAWTAHVGFNAGMWEVDSADNWYIEAYVPMLLADAMIREYEAGRLANVHIRLETELWSEWSPFPNAGPIEWSMMPSKYGTNAHANARIEGLHWSDGPLRDEGPELGPEPVPEPDVRGRSEPAVEARPQESPLAAIMLAGTKANERIARTWAWGMPAIVFLLAIIAARS